MNELQEQNTITCKNCKSTKVKLFNPESISENAYEDKPYVFDNEIYSQTICDECLTVGNVVGKITWVQP